MNKQELIEKYKEYEREACQRFLKALEQLDEPETVKVPQFVADWYEENKDDLKEVAEEVLNELEIIPVKKVEDVLGIVLK